MANTATIQNAKSVVSATTSSLRNAMSSATPGAIINVALGGPFAIDISGINKAGLGIDVVFDPAQVIGLRTSIGSGGSNLRFYGGIYDGDAIAQSVGGTSAYAIELASSCSKIGVYNATVQNTSQGCYVVGATDIELRGLNIAFSRADAVHLRNVSRVMVDSVRSEFATASWRVVYYDNATPPVYNVGPSVANATGGKWVDASHADYTQIPDGSTDITFTNNYGDYDGGGVATFGTDETLGVDRGNFSFNEVRTTGKNALVPKGTNILAVGNKVGASKLYDSDQPPAEFRIGPRISLDTHDGNSPLRPGDLVRGGLNVADAGGSVLNPTIGVAFPAQGGGTLIDMSGPVNGPAVIAPELPRIRRPSWSPLIARRSYLPPVEVPQLITPPALIWRGWRVGDYGTGSAIAQPSVSTGNNWLTIQRGAWRSVNRSLTNGHLVRHQWKLNGSVVSGQTGASYQAPVGTVIGGIQFSNDNGVSWSALAETPAIVVGS